MHYHLNTHAEALTLAAQLVPAARWQEAEGDVGQVSLDDIALEDAATEAVLVLCPDGKATLYVAGA